MESKAPDKPTARDVWMRGLFMLVLIIGFAVGQWLLNLLALVQFLWLLFAREPNGFLARFGNSLAIWLADVRTLSYLRHRGQAVPVESVAGCSRRPACAVNAPSASART